MKRADAGQEDYYRGVRTIPYDLLKELALALAGSLVLVVVLSAVLSSPDVPPVTIQSWAQNNPVDFVSTATNELAGQTTSAQYGPPYNSGSGSVQSLGPLSPQAWAGVRQPVDQPNDFVINPLKLASVGDSALTAALSEFQAASDKQKSDWLTAYAKALGSAKVQDGKVVVASGEYGQAPLLMDRLLGIARAGGLDGLLLASGHFYQTDFTRPLLFMNDGTYLSGLAQDQHLTGNQWGMMNETGQYPGQTWLWLYTLWYQLPPFNSASNADLLVVGMMGILTLLLLLVPFIPGLRDIPRWVPIYRLIWRRYYRKEAGS
jgi:hypothetical protein